MAAALCAENKGLPPIELEYAWQYHNGFGLPNEGGLRNQPYALIRRMNACYNVWQAMSEYIDSNLDTKWVNKNPKKWSIIVSVMELYTLLERGELEKLNRPVDQIINIYRQEKAIAKE